MDRLRGFARTEWLMALAVFTVVVLSRLPFLGPGYGSDADAWRIADAGRTIVETGRYTASRLPGYPVVEYAAALLDGTDPRVLDLVTAVMSAVAAAAVALSARSLGSRDAALTGLAFAFVPVVYVNSTNAMDYLWAAAFVFASLTLALRQRPLGAGALAGAALGCRVTSFVGALVAAGMLLAGRGDAAVRRSVRFAVAAAAVGLLALLPVLLRYGAGFLHAYAPTAPTLVWERATDGVWGVWGSRALGLAVAATALWLAVGNRRTALGRDAVLRRRLAVLGAGLLAYAALYLWLPAEAAYLIPAAGMLLLLLSASAPRAVHAALCAVLLLSAFLPADLAGPSKGPLLAERAARAERIAQAEGILAASRRLPDDSVVAVGGYQPYMRLLPGSRPDGAASGAEFVYAISTTDIERYRAEGVAVYYSKGMAERNLAWMGVDLAAAGALPLPDR